MDNQPTRALTDVERLDWLRLIRSENVGPITFYHLLRYYGSPGAALDALPELSRRGGRKRALKACPRATAEREIAALAEIGARLVAWGEPAYPAPLASVEDAPPVISVLGQAHLLERRTVAIVGARNASANGQRFATRLAAGLGEAELVVASGLARGIDGAAHRGALATGTIAVLAGGVDVPYPGEHKELYGEIAERGALISEQPPGVQPQGRHFPPRNRLISGLALGVVIVEAAPRSGSLITARMALEQGREVFAVPGSPLDPRCRGTNNLIRQGATLTESVEDVLQVLEGQLRTLGSGEPESVLTPGPVTPPSDADMARARDVVSDALSPSPVDVDELIRVTGATPAVVVTVLLELELAGRIERHPGHRVSLLA